MNDPHRDTDDTESIIDQLMAGNVNFRENVFKQNLKQYAEQAKGQKPSVLWIGCSDSCLQTGYIT